MVDAGERERRSNLCILLLEAGEMTGLCMIYCSDHVTTSSITLQHTSVDILYLQRAHFILKQIISHFLNIHII